MRTPETPANGRRGFVCRILTATGLAAAWQTALPRNLPNGGSQLPFLPASTRAQTYKPLKQSSFDVIGGNRDSRLIPAGGVQEVFRPGAISHIWFTIVAHGDMHLKGLVLRAWWFARSMCGAPLIVNPEHTGGRYCCYRWHGDNPVTFERYLEHSMEHGHANDRGDNFFSCSYWYQSTPDTDFPAHPPVDSRTPAVRTV